MVDLSTKWKHGTKLWDQNCQLGARYAMDNLRQIKPLPKNLSLNQLASLRKSRMLTAMQRHTATQDQYYKNLIVNLRSFHILRMLWFSFHHLQRVK